jgi:hypothetical protein
LDFFNLPNPSYLNMALGEAQPVIKADDLIGTGFAV